MSKIFSLAYKQKMIERLTGNNAVSANQVSRETGISQEALSRWLREARSMPDVPQKNRSSKTWSIDEKIRVLAAASKLAGTELTGMLEREALGLADLEQWRLALGESANGSLTTTKRIRTLEREIARKDKALAEAATLLILKKKMDHYWEGEGDVMDEETEK
jgi:transposase